MPWNLLILPLVTGYFIVTRSRLFKYKYRLLDRQRLLFEVIWVAALLLAITYLITSLAYALLPDNWLKAYLAYRPFPYLGTMLATIVIGVTFTYVSNWFRTEEAAIEKSIRKHGTAFDRLILDAIKYPQLICFTLKNGKVYIGYPKFINDLVNTGTLTIFPFTVAIGMKRTRL